MKEHVTSDPQLLPEVPALATRGQCAAGGWFCGHHGIEAFPTDWALTGPGGRPAGRQAAAHIRQSHGWPSILATCRRQYIQIQDPLIF